MFSECTFTEKVFSNASFFCSLICNFFCWRQWTQKNYLCEVKVVLGEQDVVTQGFCCRSFLFFAFMYNIVIIFYSMHSLRTRNSEDVSLAITKEKDKVET